MITTKENNKHVVVIASYIKGYGIIQLVKSLEVFQDLFGDISRSNWPFIISGPQMWARFICLLLLISMLWHRQAIFESKGDKLSSSAESRIRTHQDLRHQIASRLNARWQTDWAIEDQAKNLNSTARPYDQRAFSPLNPTAVWHSHLALAIYMFVVVNFDALAQASDIRIERRQVVFLCWKQDSNPSASQTPNRQQTECPLTNRLSQMWARFIDS